MRILFDRPLGNSQQVGLRASPEELLILNNALNEVCHGLDMEEFGTRMGAELSAVESLLAQIGAVCDQMNAPVR